MSTDSGHGRLRALANLWPRHCRPSLDLFFDHSPVYLDDSTLGCRHCRNDKDQDVVQLVCLFGTRVRG